MSLHTHSGQSITTTSFFRKIKQKIQTITHPSANPSFKLESMEPRLLLSASPTYIDILTTDGQPTDPAIIDDLIKSFGPTIDDHSTNDLGGGSFDSLSWKFPQPDGLGTPVTITYSYSNLLDPNLDSDLSIQDIKTATEEALGLWATYAPLNFVEVPDYGGAPSNGNEWGGDGQIRIGHREIGGNVLAFATIPASSVVFDTTKNWRYGSGSGTRFHEVMVHEIGHSLGFGHENEIPSIMNAGIQGVYDGPGTGFLFQDDIDGIQFKYGAGVGSVTPLSTNTMPQTEYDTYTIDEDTTLTRNIQLGNAIITSDQVWSYFDEGTDLGQIWYGPGFDDSTWDSGPGPLGYGDGGLGTEVSFGSDADDKHITTYFRSEFNIADANALDMLQLRITRDDGAAIYINGVEITRINLQDNATFDTPALYNAGNFEDGDMILNLDVDDLPPGLLQTGNNTIAVEVHQESPTSSDIRLDLELYELIANNGLTANDPGSGNTTAATLTIEPLNGDVSLNTDGSFTYTPDDNFNGVDTFEYRLYDTFNTSIPTVVTINVTPVTDNPVATDDNYTAYEDDLFRVTNPEVIVPAGSNWSYLDDGSDQGTAWRDFDFDDTTWSSGPAQLGYGDNDEATETSFIDTDNDETNGIQKNATTYFRHAFNIENPNNIAQLFVELQRDDGAAVYLNGVEIVRDNLDDDAAFDDFADDTITGNDEDTFNNFTIDIDALPPNTLRTGRNVLAVEIHQESDSSSDISFDLQLSSILGGPRITANDFHPDGDFPITPQILTQPQNGTLFFNPDGTFDYQPDPNFFGTDTFTYRVGSVTAPTQVIDTGAIWKYLDNGSNQSTAWQAPGYDDSSWAQGPSQLGYGDDDEQTEVSFIDVDPVEDGTQKNATTYFRHEFQLTDISTVGNFIINVLRDDAVALYLNGTEIFRDDNLPDGAAFNTYADGTMSSETNFSSDINVDISLLQEGTNILAAEIHQANDTSSDISFDLHAFVERTIFSDPATVTIEVLPTNDIPVPVDDPTPGTAYEIDKNTTLFFGESIRTIIDDTQNWSYLDDGSNQGTAWRETNFDDTSWPTGLPELGYGDGDETTEVSFIDTDPIEGGTQKNATTYFRTTINLNNVDQITQLDVSLKRDDGAAVYLNGHLIILTNLEENAAFDDFADGTTSSEDEFTDYTINIDDLPPNLLIEGENVIAAEVHQASDSSSDMSFHLRMNATLLTPGSLLENDIEIDGDNITAILETSPANGTLQLNPDGTLTYTPNQDFTGEDQFTYTIADDPNILLLPRQSVWSYLDDGSNQGTAWRATGFDDDSWSSGPAQLGYGDNDEQTEVSFIDTDGDESNDIQKNATTYFRSSVNINNIDQYGSFLASILRDDAAAVYINGTEVYRDTNLAADAAFDTYADANVADEDEFVDFPVPSSVLVEGRNVIAVEIHQNSETSSDISFDFELLAGIKSQTAATVRILVIDDDPGILGDFDNDADVDADDIDLLREAILSGNNDLVFDLTNDNQLTEADLDDHVQTILGTVSGDANLDRIVNLEDLAKLATNFGQSPRGWAEGNFTLDRVVNLADLAKLATNFGTDLSTGQAASTDLLSQTQAIQFSTPSATSDADDSNWNHIHNVLNEA